MSRISDLGDRILAQHDALGRRLRTILRPGLAPERVREMTAHLPVHLPNAAVELFTWKDGTRRGIAGFDQTSLFPDYCLMPLYEAIYNYHLNAEAQPGRWEVCWFPLFSTSDGECLLIDCGPHSKKDGSIIEVAYHSEAKVTLFESLTSMLEVVASRFESGAIRISGDGLLEGTFALGKPPRPE